MSLRDVGCNYRLLPSPSYQIWYCEPSQNVTIGKKRQSWFLLFCNVLLFTVWFNSILQGFPMWCKNLIYDSTLKPPSLLRFWLNIIWCDTSILKNRVSVSYNGLLLPTLAARSLQIVQGVPHFYFLCISGKCESSIWYTVLYSLSNKSY